MKQNKRIPEAWQINHGSRPGSTPECIAEREVINILWLIFKEYNTAPKKRVKFRQEVTRNDSLTMLKSFIFQKQGMLLWMRGKGFVRSPFLWRLGKLGVGGDVETVLDILAPAGKEKGDRLFLEKTDPV